MDIKNIRTNCVANELIKEYTMLRNEHDVESFKASTIYCVKLRGGLVANTSHSPYLMKPISSSPYGFKKFDTIDFECISTGGEVWITDQKALLSIPNLIVDAINELIEIATCEHCYVGYGAKDAYLIANALIDITRRFGQSGLDLRGKQCELPNGMKAYATVLTSKTFHLIYHIFALDGAIQTWFHMADHYWDGVSTEDLWIHKKEAEKSGLYQARSIIKQAIKVLNQEVAK